MFLAAYFCSWTLIYNEKNIINILTLLLYLVGKHTVFAQVDFTDYKEG